MGGSLTEDEFKTINIKNNKIKNFVETGTYHADTTLMAAKHYDHVYTTEIVDKLFTDSKKRAEDEHVTNIDFLFGDSVELLDIIMPKIKDGAVFFLDAHQSGSDTSYNKKQLVPLLEELKKIFSYELGPSVFILDDLRFWKDQSITAHDWAHISTPNVIRLFVENGKEVDDFYEFNDRFWVFTN
jgi:hypothetical protein